MTGPRVRYGEAPEFVLHYPSCSACGEDLDNDGDGWQCPKCATSWGLDASDGDKGELWPDWSGESYDDALPVISHNEGPAAPWIEHPYVLWLTPSGRDMRLCNSCYRPASLHVAKEAKS